MRAVVRDAKKGAVWARQGCEVALADMNDATALTKAFTATQGVLILLPPNFDPEPGFPEVRSILRALQVALTRARPERVVGISTVGAQASQENLLSQHTLHERVLGELPLPIRSCGRRGSWKTRHGTWRLPVIRVSYIVFCSRWSGGFRWSRPPTSAGVAAWLLQEKAAGRRVVELEGPHPVSPADVAAALGHLLGRSVSAQSVPRETWETLFRSQGMRNPLPRIQMLDGFNAGWLRFEHEPLKGEVGLDTVLGGLIEHAG